MLKFASDRRATRRIWFGSLEETVAGLEVSGRVRMKPRMLKVADNHWIRVDPDEILYFEEVAPGQTDWVTLRGRLKDMEANTIDQALAKACRAGVYIRVSDKFAGAPSRICGVRLQRTGFHVLEVEGMGGIEEIPLDPLRLKALDECLEVLGLGGGFLVSEPEDF